jgi:integral membrane protein
VAVFTVGEPAIYKTILTMLKFFNTKIGRLRLIAFLEGISLLLLIGIAVPLKYLYQDPSLVKAIGPVHGLLFLFFVLNTISVGIAYKWEFRTTTWKVLLACIIPFCTFYIDKMILSRMKA